MKPILSILFILFLSLSPNPSLKAQINPAGFGQMKCYKTFNDYLKDNFVEADQIEGKFFKKGKEKVAEYKSCWGYKATYKLNATKKSSAVEWTELRRMSPDGSYLVLIAGSLCLYLEGYKMPDSHQRMNYVTTNTTVPFQASAELDGEIFKFTQKNIEEHSEDDPQFMSMVKQIKQVQGTSTVEEYFDKRVNAIQFYNKRHPSKNPEYVDQ